MRTAIILSGLFSLALTQSTSAATTTAPLTPQASCLSKCSAGDVNCQAICVGVPHPGSAQTNATTDCVAKCDQGDGSTAASQAYSKCRDACISSYIITAPGNTAAPGGEYTTPAIPGVATTMSTAVANANAAVSGSNSASATTATGTAKAAQSTGSAATVQLTAAGGLLGIAMAAFAWL